MLSYVSPEKRAILRWLGLAAVLLLALAAVELVLGVGIGPVEAGDYCGIAVVGVAALACGLRARWVERSRRAWSLAALALLLMMLGFLDDALTTGFGLGIDDGLYTAANLALAATVVSLCAGRIVPRHSFLVDCVDAGLILAALASATLIPLAAAWASRESNVAVPTVTYPLVDAVLVTMLAVAAAASGWRPGREILFLGGALLVLTVADSGYFFSLRAGDDEIGRIELLWYLAAAGIGFAAWQAPPPRLREGIRPSTAAIGLAVSAAAVATGVLIADAFVDLPPAATVLAALALLGSALRLAMAFSEVRRLADERRVGLVDALTELPNEEGFSRHLTEVLVAGEGPVAVLLIELDDFQGLTSALGYGVADALLSSVGRTLRIACGEGGRAARFGNDRFALALDGCDRYAAREAAQSIAAEIGTATEVAGLTLRIHPSIGIAVSSAAEADPELLLRRADRAVQDNRASPGSIAFFDGDLEDESAALELAGELKRALGAREIELFLQPQVEIASGRLCGAETLVRWRHPRHGLLTPDRFLPVVARTDLASEFSDYVLRRGIEIGAQLRAAGHPLPVSVNLTSDDLVEGGLAVRLERMLADADALVVEVTEEGAFLDIDAARRTLEAVRVLGVQVSLDDFGTGSSSLSHLQELPADELKLDRSFVANVTSDPGSAAIVAGVIDIAHALGMRVVGEGIETREQWEAMARLGCDVAQGWILGAAVPPEEFEVGYDALVTRARAVAEIRAPGC